MNIKTAKQHFKIERHLQQLGHRPEKVSGDSVWFKSPFRDEKTASFKVHREKNIWYDHGMGDGGDSIKFVKVLYKLPNISETLRKMNELTGKSNVNQTPPPRQPATDRQPKEKRPKVEITSIGPIQHPRLVEYVRQRGIGLGLASNYLKEIHYKVGEKKYFALSFANDTGLQTGAGFAVRNEHFKGNLGPMDLRTIPGDSRSKDVAVFEGVFDFLSHRELLTTDDLNPTAIVLNSASMKQKALERIRSLRPEHVQLYLDHDKAGRDLVEFFRSELSGIPVEDKSGLYRGFGDFNEFHAAKTASIRHLDNVSHVKLVNRQLEKEDPSF